MKTDAQLQADLEIGKAHSLAEREAAVGAAKSTAGFSKVVDRLAVEA